MTYEWSVVLFAFGVGLLVGKWAEVRRWREKGDHDYMNCMESGGALYQVRREPPVDTPTKRA